VVEAQATGLAERVAVILRRKKMRNRTVQVNSSAHECFRFSRKRHVKEKEPARLKASEAFRKARYVVRDVLEHVKAKYMIERIGGKR